MAFRRSRRRRSFGSRSRVGGRNRRKKRVSRSYFVSRGGIRL